MSLGRIVKLPSGSTLELYPSMTSTESEALQGRLERDLDWEQRDIVLFGRRIPQPRLIAWCGELPYRYSGQTLEPRPFHPEVRRTVELASEHAGVAFNHVLLNWYRGGQDSMGYHSDDEPELGDDPTIASLSLGAPRTFVLKSRRDRREPPTRIELTAGILLVMRPPCQARYRHAVPKQATLADPRISLTFRRVLTAPA